MTTARIAGGSVAIALACAIAGCGVGTDAQGGGAAVPFKLGTFERGGTPFVGLVLKDTQIVDIAQANTAFEAANASAPKLAAPADMKQIIARYDTDWKGRLAAIAKDVSTAKAAPAYAYAIGSLKVLPPLRPSLILNAGGNYVEHTAGIAAQQQRTGAAPEAAAKAVSAPGIWERKPDDTRDNPYLFQKSPTVVSGPTDPIVVPRGRTNIDYECEFNVVIGKRAKYVPVANAADFIFGYTIQIDVSDRGGRGDRKMGGSDWLIGKNHDTFGPLGPFIVPKEFVKDPMNTRHVFTLNETVMQDSNTNRMSHNIYELLAYASNILTLNVGDLISGGSPAGTNIERAEPRWMRAGDTATCAIDGIGTQVHKVVAESDMQGTQ
ncbi:MAG: fumarylacetoacetate hydrolase family protein [Vicinamibacterales bacterium]|jgi:2-keto-4-pentenoate hydratase/2-oxohepta-3-ene-1,7-dioic acid hydratase in catechol pathway